MTIFDITNKSKALESLAIFLQRDIEEIKQYMEHHIQDYDASKLLETLNVDHSTLPFDTVQLVGMHVTSNDDQCAFIKQHGLSNLYAVLSTQNSLTAYLKEHQVVFDLLDKNISYQGKSESLSEPKFQRLKEKIYDDLSTHVYLRVGDFGYYSAKNQIRPEVLTLLAEIYNDDELLSYWDIDHQTYLIKFIEDLSNFDLASLAPSQNREDVLLQLVYYAMDVIALNEHVELWCQLKTGYRVPPQNIIDIHDFYNN